MIHHTPDIRNQLAFAAGAGQLVRVFRDGIEDGAVVGYVEAYGDQLALFSIVDEAVRYDGFEVLYIDDITEIEIPHPHAEFHEDALQLQGLVRPEAPSLDLDEPRGFFESVMERAPLVTLYREIAEPDDVYIGAVRDVDDRFVTIIEVTPDAEFEHAPTKLLIEEVTRINFGTAYETLLLAVASRRGNRPPAI
jgi:hypothetical protein